MRTVRAEKDAGGKTLSQERGSWRKGWRKKWKKRLVLGAVVMIWAAGGWNGTVCQAAERSGAMAEAQSETILWESSREQPWGLRDPNQSWELDELESLEALEGEVSDEELDQALKEYFQELDLESGAQPELAAEKIQNPVLAMTAESSGRLRYTLPNGNYFISSVPCGMITSDPVDLELPEGIIGLVQKDEEAETFPDSWHFTEKGVYHIRLLVLRPPEETAADYHIYEVEFYVTIIDKIDNTLGAVPAPEGFVITWVRLDGRPQKVEQERCFFLKEDGVYEIGYEAAGKEPIPAMTAFTRDTVAPFLSFSREMEPGGIPGDTEFYPSEPGCRVWMHYNGNRGYAVTNRLTAAGNYELSVEDQAGNSRIYHVKIRQVYDGADWRLLAAAAVVMAFGAIRLLMARRNLKVL